jgi:uncharacterized protein CbrC (UPF0167 family)
MPLRYFNGPVSDMSFLLSQTKVCSLCGRKGACFHLDFATVSPSFRDADPTRPSLGCVECLKEGRFTFDRKLENGTLDVVSDERLALLARTPLVDTWQACRWLLHCDDAMTYLGTWGPSDFNECAPDGDGRALFFAMTSAEQHGLWDRSKEESGTNTHVWAATYYVFQCLHCKQIRGYWDAP